MVWTLATDQIWAITEKLWMYSWYTVIFLFPKQERQCVLDKKVSFFGYNQVSITSKGASCSQIHTVNSYTTTGCHTPDRGTWICEQRCQVLLQDQSLNKQL